MTAGYFGWSKPILSERVWLGGRYFANWNEDAAGPLTQSEPPSTIVVPMHDGSAILQSPYRGPDKPLAVAGSSFGVALLADDEADYYWLLGLASLGRALYYFPGLPAADSFRAIAGQAYQLTRPQAAGIVPPISGAPINDPDFVLDGTPNPAAATATGRTVNALLSGELTVWYMPVYLVSVRDAQRSIGSGGELVINTTLLELVA